MNIESYRAYCIAKKGVTEEFPFGEQILVYKVMGKVFALTNVEEFGSINLKVDPEKGVELREQYASVQPGYHMNKKHWITVLIDGSIPDKLLKQWIDDSYQLVVSGLPKKQQAALQTL
ncbi:MmcQ/YjbR family DNA-binding protein [Ohtaekwangia koreensis]|uniref:Predicted DNA-binding protein, MmcQ/YjbR family n=1 Tax=Ohtaekwangia koreensis TaxID=688867 RepID=A0A1T5K147_9BACT|nr:MmcQ/YjbR family DNA-binding protein [Ohtaekwangia koreensis]SKC57218.1 Predicted DNA-binding protein, MmcQ/YjbR family [Ohtaekwangia koreensis]